MAPPQRKQVYRLALRKRMDGARRSALLLDRMVASGQTIELIPGVQAEQVRIRLPFENVGVDVDFVAGKLVHRLAAVGKTNRRRKALRTERLHSQARGDFFAGK